MQVTDKQVEAAPEREPYTVTGHEVREAMIYIERDYYENPDAYILDFLNLLGIVVRQITLPRVSDQKFIPRPKQHWQQQQQPVPNAAMPTWELVMRDMENRNKACIEKYGTPLQPHNGRNSLQDAYEEALDLAVYLKNAIIELEKGN
jgi:hypothetical protein